MIKYIGSIGKIFWQVLKDLFLLLIIPIIIGVALAIWLLCK